MFPLSTNYHAFSATNLDDDDNNNNNNNNNNKRDKATSQGDTAHTAHVYLCGPGRLTVT